MPKLVSLSLLSFLLAAFVPSTLGQTSNAVCLPYYRWTSNSQNKTPCEVAASLIAVCNGGRFEVLPLEEGQHYQGPTMVANANVCMCNSVTYSLMAACGLCQGRIAMRWSEWATNCPNVTFNEFPGRIPEDLRVPGWAFHDVKEKDMFDQFLARDNANATESTAIPTPTNPSPTEAAPSETETGSVSTEAGSAESSEGEEAEESTAEEPEVDIERANLVGGAVVGSLLGTGLIVVLAWALLRHRRRAKARVQTVEKPSGETPQA